MREREEPKPNQTNCHEEYSSVRLCLEPVRGMNVSSSVVQKKRTCQCATQMMFKAIYRDAKSGYCCTPYLSACLRILTQSALAFLRTYSCRRWVILYCGSHHFRFHLPIRFAKLFSHTILVAECRRSLNGCAYVIIYFAHLIWWQPAG